MARSPQHLDGRFENPQPLHNSLLGTLETMLDADVNVQAENQVRSSHGLHVFDDLQITLVGIDVLHAPVREGMRRAGRQQQPMLARQANRSSPQVGDIFPGLADRPAHAGPDLDDRLMHLGFDLLLEQHLALGDELGVDVRAEVERLGVDGLVFLFDAEGEGRPHGACREFKVQSAKFKVPVKS